MHLSLPRGRTRQTTDSSDIRTYSTASVTHTVTHTVTHMRNESKVLDKGAVPTRGLNKSASISLEQRLRRLFFGFSCQRTSRVSKWRRLKAQNVAESVETLHCLRSA